MKVERGLKRLVTVISLIFLIIGLGGFVAFLVYHTKLNRHEATVVEIKEDPEYIAFSEAQKK